MNQDLAIAIGFTGAGALNLVLNQILFYRIERVDPVNFAKLGKPHVIMNNRPSHAIPLLKMFFTSRYLPDDKACRVLINIIRIYAVLSLAAIAIFGVLLHLEVKP